MGKIGDDLHVIAGRGSSQAFNELIDNQNFPIASLENQHILLSRVVEVVTLVGPSDDKINLAVHSRLQQYLQDTDLSSIEEAELSWITEPLILKAFVFQARSSVASLQKYINTLCKFPEGTPEFSKIAETKNALVMNFQRYFKDNILQSSC
jgi:hypothetical protein